MSIIDIHTHLGCPANWQSITSFTPDEFPQSGCETPFSIGIHPWFISADPASQLLRLRSIVESCGPIAVGECGLDALRGPSVDVQESVLLKQLDLAVENNLPVVFHVVRKYDIILNLVKRYHGSLRSIVHGFRGSPELASQLRHAGLEISFGRVFNIDSVTATPLDRLFVETDGKCQIIDVLEAISRAKGVGIDELKKSVIMNTSIFFNQ